MIVVRGIYQGKSVELLEPVNVKQGMEVEVIFHNTEQNKEIFFIKSMQQEIDRMNKGFALGGGHYYQRRDELHER